MNAIYCDAKYEEESKSWVFSHNMKRTWFVPIRSQVARDQQSQVTWGGNTDFTWLMILHEKSQSDVHCYFSSHLDKFCNKVIETVTGPRDRELVMILETYWTYQFLEPINVQFVWVYDSVRSCGPFNYMANSSNRPFRWCPNNSL